MEARKIKSNQDGNFTIKIRKMDLNSVQNLIRDIQRNLRLVDQNEPLHVIG